jgi:hypothetical protein
MDAVANSLTYDPLERLHLRRPVDRVDFIADQCRGKRVLDVGCYDETALVKRDTNHWLHGRISAVASQVVGIDISSKIPPEGIRTADNAIILKGDGSRPSVEQEIDLVVAGEFIEHIENPLEFFRYLRQRYAGRQMVVSTPNGSSFANTLLGAAGREAQHPDHLQIFTYKILCTLCGRASFPEWEIIPYYFRATETILHSSGMKKAAAGMVQRFVNGVEWTFPLLSCGYIVRATL